MVDKRPEGGGKSRKQARISEVNDPGIMIP